MPARVIIDPDLCIGSAECNRLAPEAFRLDEDGIVIFVAPEAVGRERLLEACDSCPVDAISVFDAEGMQIVP